MNTLTIIDKGLADYQTLIAGLPEGSEILWLDTNRDGIAQIADYLATPTREASGGASATRRHDADLTAIHILSHGGPGALFLGNTALTAHNIEAYARPLAEIGRALTATGDILLYGCNVAQGENGNSMCAERRH